MPEKPHTEKIQAKHLFTQEERNDLSDELTLTMMEEDRLDGELASIKSDYKGKIEAAQLRRNRLASKIRERSEMRETLAVVLFSTPKPGRKSFYFASQVGSNGTFVPGEFIREEEMTHADLQRTLPLEEAAVEMGKNLLSRDVPPEGFALVTEGGAMMGDLCWNHSARVWESVIGSLAQVDQYFALARPLNADAGTTPVVEALAAAKPERKPREKFTQPPGTVNVAGKEEHYLILDLSAVETEAGIRAEFKAAYRRAKWDRLSVGEVVKLLDGLPVDGMKSVLSLYTYQPEAANV